MASYNANSYEFTGRENDGAGLYYYRARYYSPTLQRFIAQDPIGFHGGLNLYSYVGDDPIDVFDLLGTCPWWVHGIAPLVDIVGEIAGHAVGDIAVPEAGPFAGELLGFITGGVLSLPVELAVAYTCNDLPDPNPLPPPDQPFVPIFNPLLPPGTPVCT